MVDDVVSFDNDEVALLCFVLDAHGTAPPVRGIGWSAGWQEGAIEAAQVILAARTELGLEDE